LLSERFKENEVSEDRYKDIERELIVLTESTLETARELATQHYSEVIGLVRQAWSLLSEKLRDVEQSVGHELGLASDTFVGGVTVAPAIGSRVTLVVATKQKESVDTTKIVKGAKEGAVLGTITGVAGVAVWAIAGMAFPPALAVAGVVASYSATYAVIGAARGYRNADIVVENVVSRSDVEKQVKQLAKKLKDEVPGPTGAWVRDRVEDLMRDFQDRMTGRLASLQRALDDASNLANDEERRSRILELESTTLALKKDVKWLEDFASRVRPRPVS